MEKTTVLIRWMNHTPCNITFRPLALGIYIYKRMRRSDEKSLQVLEFHSAHHLHPVFDHFHDLIPRALFPGAPHDSYYFHDSASLFSQKLPARNRFENYYKDTPPETSILYPFIHFASSVQRKATTLPMSSAFPTRPSAV